MKENKQHFNLIKLLINYIFGEFFNFFNHRTKAILPQRIGDYNFVSKFEKNGTKKNFLLGMYKNSKGQKAFAKMWSANYRDFNYYSLKNEVLVSKILNSAMNKNRKFLPAELSRLSIPKLITSEEKENYLIMLTEYIQGIEAFSLPSERKIDLYFKTIKFIHFLGTKLTLKQKGSISKRTPFDFVLLYPMLITKAAISHPRAALYVIMGIPIFLRCLPALFKENIFVLSHRDLHFRNILTAANKDYVIDLQLCVLAHPIHDLTITLRYLWGKDNFYTEFLAEILKRNQNSPYFETLFRGLSVNSATHGLTDKNFPKGKIAFWIDFLKYAIKHKPYSEVKIP